MRKLIGISCLFVAQMVCQTHYANAQKAAPPVGVLAMMGSQIPGALSPGRATAGHLHDKVPATRSSSTALRPPPVFFITAGRTIAANLKQKRTSELFLKWSRVTGAKSYVVQICQSPQCEQSREVGDKFTSSRIEGFADLATVAETQYVSTSFKRGTTYRFRIIAIDAEGRRG